MRRFLLSFFASLTVVTIALGFPMLAQASTVAIPWLTEYETDLSNVGFLSDDEQILMSDALISCAQSDCRPATTPDVDFRKAIAEGYSSYYQDGSEIKMSDAQKAYAQAKSKVVRKYYKPSANQHYSKADYAALKRARQYRLASTSSDIAKASTSTGLDSGTVIASSYAQDDDMISALSALDASAGVKASLGSVLRGSLAFLGKANDVTGAALFGVFVGNKALSFFDVDQSAECRKITNGVARFALGIGSVCQSYDDALVSHVGYDTYNFHNLCYLNVTNGVKAVWCFDSFRFPIGQSSARIISGSPTRSTYPLPGPTNLVFSQGKLGYQSPFIDAIGSSPTEGYVFNTGNACHDSDSACVSIASSGLLSIVPGNYDKPVHYDASPRSSTDFDTSVQSAKATPTVTVQGSDGKTYSATGDPQSQGGRVSLPSVALPDGVTPQAVTVSKAVVADDGTTKTLVDHQPLEMPKKTNGTLDLIDQATGKSCYAEAYACADWATQTQTATGTAVSLDNQTTTQTSPKTLPFKCVWAGADGASSELGIGECTALKSAFREDTQATGATATDPSTGVSIPAPTEPKADGDVSFGQCVTSEVSWNPVSWVFVPVKCALKWAFEPDQDNLTTKTVMVQQQAHYSLPGKLQQTFVAALPDQPADECLGPEMSISAMGYTLFDHSHPLSVCKGSGLDFLPTISKIVITLFAGIGAVFIIRHHLSQVVGMDDTGASDDH